MIKDNKSPIPYFFSQPMAYPGPDFAAVKDNAERLTPGENILVFPMRGAAPISLTLSRPQPRGFYAASGLFRAN